MAWSCFGQTHPVRKQVSEQESLGPVPAQCNWPAASFPLSDSVAFFHRRPGSYCAKPAWIWFGSGWLCQVLAQQIQPGSKPVCKNHLACFWLALLSQSGSDANQIQHVYLAGTPKEQKSCSVHDDMHAAIWRVPKSGMIAPTTVKGKQAPKWLPPERHLWAGVRFQCAGFQSQQPAHSLPWNTPSMNCPWRCNTTLSIHCGNYSLP